MNTKLVEDIAAAVLYEGYLLYPYRASAIKNKQRWNFGVLYPRSYAEQQSGSDTWWMQTECLVRAGLNARLDLRVRFLHIVPRGRENNLVNAQAARDREVIMPVLDLSDLASHPTRLSFMFPPDDDQACLEGIIETSSELVGDDLFKIRVGIFNQGPFAGSTREDALVQSLVSTHTILGVEDGEFISLLDPPAELREAVGLCKNIGTWPVLVGEQDQRDAMLSSPIILYDYPQIAPESSGALFDGTEIDEILTLRIMTLTDQEKLEMCLTDDRARQILERTESMPHEQFMKMHGVLRGLRDVQEELL